MNKYLITITILCFLASAAVVLAALNLDFTISLPRNYFYPNETIPITINVVNREVTFSARNLTLLIIVGQRTFNFNLGDLSASQSISQNITLPELPSGTYVIRGILNYTGYLGETATVETYNSFDVRLPEIQLFPKNIFIKSFEIPDNVTQNKSYQAVVTVINNGTIPADLIASVNSVDSNVSETFHLDPQQTQSITLDVISNNAGITILEARVYFVVDNIKYLINYIGKNVFVKENKVAKISFDRIELVNKPDGQIHQNDEAQLKIYLRNDGNGAASDVKGTLSSSEINVTKSTADYKLLLSKESNAQDYFSIKTINTSVGQHNLTLDVTFTDLSGSHSTSLQIPIDVKQDLQPSCNVDSDCGGDEICGNNTCQKLSCVCGEANNHQCVNYSCCSDSDCQEGYVCSGEKHSCSPSSQLKRDVLIVTTSKLQTSAEFNATLKAYRNVLSAEGLSSFYAVLDSPTIELLFNVKVQNISDWKSLKYVTDKIVYKLNSKYILILGGTDIVPMPPAKTDAEIPTIPPSDDRYADLSLDGLLDVAIGRMPTSSGGSIQPIINSLTAAINVHKDNSVGKKIIVADTCLFAPPKCFGINDINMISESVLNAKCEQTNNCYPAPPSCNSNGCSKKSDFLSLISEPQVLSIDGHGDPYGFYAHAKDGNWYTILKSKDVTEFKSNPLFFSIACFGGSIDCDNNSNNPWMNGCVSNDGSVFSFISKGTVAYIGNTRFGMFGYTASHLSIFYGNLKTGKTIGEAMMLMKNSELKSCWDENCRATTYELQLYGDPTIKLTGV